MGRTRRFGLSGLRDESLLSIAALQLCRDTDLDETSSEHGPLSRARRRLAECFLTQFRGRWVPLSRNLWGNSYQRWTGSTRFKRSSWEDLVFQYHMRVFTAPEKWKVGPGLERTMGDVKVQIDDDERHSSHSGPSNPLRMMEVRYSVGLRTTWRWDSPIFSLVTMTDSTTGHHLKELPQLESTSEWDMAGIHPSTRATGLAAFAFRIQSLFLQWETQWSRLIDELGNLPNADVSYYRTTIPTVPMTIPAVDISGILWSFL